MPNSPLKRLVLKGSRIVTMDAERRIVDGDVVVQDGRSRWFGGRAGGRADGTTVIDCRRLVILPGLVQAHIHLCQTLFRGPDDTTAARPRITT